MGGWTSGNFFLSSTIAGLRLAEHRVRLAGARRAVCKAGAVVAVDHGGDDAPHQPRVHLARAALWAERRVKLVRVVVELLQPEVVAAAHLLVRVAREDLVALCDGQAVHRASGRLGRRERPHAHANHETVVVWPARRRRLVDRRRRTHARPAGAAARASARLAHGGLSTLPQEEFYPNWLEKKNCASTPSHNTGHRTGAHWH